MENMHTDVSDDITFPFVERNPFYSSFVLLNRLELLTLNLTKSPCQGWVCFPVSCLTFLMTKKTPDTRS